MTLDNQPRSAITSTPSHQAGPRVRPMLVLTVVLIAALAINVETTIVNVALPTLNAELGASTRGLQWIVDAYNLAFAALVLAGGTVGDKFGRRGTLIAGLVLFAASSVAAALCTSTGPLIGARLVMGMAAALIYRTTLAIITDTFRDPRQRAAAIGVWGAVTGLGVAIGPILGGALLESFWWGSLFLALAPLALVAAMGAALLIPRSTRDETSRLDRVKLQLSVVMLGALVYTIIEAPDRGWGSAATIGGFVVAIAAAVAFAWWERRRSDPLLDVRLFTNLRFSAASGAVTVAFFALFGFIFLITQVLPTAAGLRAAGDRRPNPPGGAVDRGRLGTGHPHRGRPGVGTKAVVFIGLVMLAAAFFWVTWIDVDVSYLVVAGQMVLLGGGLRLSAGHRLDHGSRRPEQAGAGSAVNDATRQIGGTLGVAVLGSIFSTLYIRHLSDSAALGSLPAPVQETAREGLAQGLQVAARAPAPMAEALRDNVSEAFMAGLHAGCMTAGAVYTWPVHSSR